MIKNVIKLVGGVFLFWVVLAGSVVICDYVYVKCNDASWHDGRLVALPPLSSLGE